MNWGDLVGALSGVAVAVLRLVGVRSSRGRRRDQIKRDLEIVQLLPEASAARSELLAHIEDSLNVLIKDERERRRNPSGVVLGLVLVGIAGWAASAATRGGSAWWWLLAIPLGAIGLFGAVDDATRRRRDERGRPIEE